MGQRKGWCSPEQPKQMSRGGQEQSKGTGIRPWGTPGPAGLRDLLNESWCDGTRQHHVDFLSCEFIQTLLKPMQAPTASSRKDPPWLSTTRVKKYLLVFVVVALFVLEGRVNDRLIHLLLPPHDFVACARSPSVIIFPNHPVHQKSTVVSLTLQDTS